MRLIRNGLKIFFLLALFAAVSIPAYYLSIRLGFIPESVPISGTGSMFPTFPKGNGTDSASLSRQIIATPAMKRFPGGLQIGPNRYFANQLHKYDIISFENSKTREITMNELGHESGFVKRIIGMPGDTVEIRDGFVWINGQRLTEDFTAMGRSTFGGKYLPDCQKLPIPEGFVFALGDNRKASNDSRDDLGLIAISDIDHMLAYSDQGPYRFLWRDASRDYLLANHPVLDTTEYLNLLNQKRREYQLPPLKHQPKLDSSAAVRAATILKYNDMSFTATRSGMTMEKAMNQAGYSNIVFGEAPTLGFYDAHELIDNFFQFPQSRNFLLNKDFQDTGLAASVGNLNGCPVQIVVQHLAGYVPPNYKPDVVTSWEKALKQLKDVLPGWEKAKDYPFFYNLNQAELDEVVRLIKLRISHMEAIVARMKANEWLTPEEKSWYEQDEQLAKQLEQLTRKLNNL